MDKNFINLVVVSPTPELDKAIIGLALEEFILLKLVRRGQYVDQSKPKDKQIVEFHILERPLNSLDQTISISGATANIISSTLNSVCEKLCDTINLSDATNIVERDLINLSLIVSDISKESK